MINPTHHGTVAHLLEIAIQAERQTEQFYLGLSRKFSRVEDVAAFWKSYAGEEAGHARWLEDLRARVSADQLSHAADPEKLLQAQRTTAVWPEERLAAIQDLQEAYEVANELESGEINTVFEFLIGNFAHDEETRVFLKSLLRTHVDRLMSDFPAPYREAAIRRAVQAGV